ncbi:MAG: ABC transporter substrate-binding protein [Pseudomonadales bacterium]|nr:ABC transporter substrate-binding protein [Pseudomonadales bacterium]
MRILIFIVFSCLTSSVLAAEEPYDAVNRATQQMLVRLVEIQPRYETDRQWFFDQLDETISPFIDFEGYSRNVMAKYFRRASAQQQQQFQAAFHRSLVETYAKALVEFNNERVEVLKPTKPQKKPGRAKITLAVHSHDGPVFNIRYDLRLLEEQWKLRNLVIDGINLGLQFRSQFSAQMDSANGNMDLVIKRWNDG